MSKIEELDKAINENAHGEMQYTVAELIAALQKAPHGLPVMHEGCDCLGVADGVELIYDRSGQPEYILITRSND